MKDKTSGVYLRSKLSKLRKRARIKGLLCTLSIGDFVNLRSGKCIYCGSENFITVDRKDNNTGYTSENSVSCCFMCNNIKGNILSFEEMKIIGEAISKVRKINKKFWHYAPWGKN